MKEKNRIEFEGLLENEEFIRMLKKDRISAEEYLLTMLKDYPAKEEIILDAVDFLDHYMLKQPIEQETIDEMWKSVLEKSRTTKRYTRFYTGAILKVAASVAILLLFSFFIYYLVPEDRLTKFAAKQIKMEDEAKIIISDGTEYKLTTNESRIIYDKNGKEIAIEEKDSTIEKFTNSTENKEKTEYNRIIVPYGRRHSLKLSDGTMVQLNSGSSLVFPAMFLGNQREVYLKGEGYFTVTKKEKMPFIVKTDNVNIKVLGTQFNVSAYENENFTSAVLVEGSVEVYTNKFLKKDQCKIVPGQGYFYSAANSDYNVRNVDVNEYISWIDGMLQFKGQSFASIIAKIEKFYNVSINIKDDELAKRSISGKLVLCNDFEETMAYMASTTKSRFYSEKGTYIFMK